jgi:uncharacterized protein (DUF488 family)
MNDFKTDRFSGKLLTIGYEGKDVEAFFSILLFNEISLLCDVRKNPVSRKPGFSKKALTARCIKSGIEYAHHPEFGIDSNLRKDLHTEQDYHNLFSIYKQTVLVDTIIQQRQLLEEIKKGKTIALLCFEADPLRCHRSRLAEAVVCLAERNIRIVNL